MLSEVTEAVSERVVTTARLAEGVSVVERERERYREGEREREKGREREREREGEREGEGERERDNEREREREGERIHMDMLELKRQLSSSYAGDRLKKNKNSDAIWPRRA